MVIAKFFKKILWLIFSVDYTILWSSYSNKNNSLGQRETNPSFNNPECLRLQQPTNHNFLISWPLFRVMSESIRRKRLLQIFISGIFDALIENWRNEALIRARPWLHREKSFKHHWPDYPSGTSPVDVQCYVNCYLVNVLRKLNKVQDFGIYGKHKILCFANTSTNWRWMSLIFACRSNSCTLIFFSWKTDKSRFEFIYMTVWFTVFLLNLY